MKPGPTPMELADTAARRERLSWRLFWLGWLLIAQPAIGLLLVNMFANVLQFFATAEFTPQLPGEHRAKHFRFWFLFASELITAVTLTALAGVFLFKGRLALQACRPLAIFAVVAAMPALVVWLAEITSRLGADKHGILSMAVMLGVLFLIPLLHFLWELFWAPPGHAGPGRVPTVAAMMLSLVMVAIMPVALGIAVNNSFGHAAIRR